MGLRVALVGHIAEPPILPLPRSLRAARMLFHLRNFTRVATPDAELVDHLTYLRRLNKKFQDQDLSVWEMYLCSGLLLASHLERHAFDVLLANHLHLDQRGGEVDRLRAFRPDLVALSTTFILSPEHLARACRYLRSIVPDSLIVAGGHHVHVSLLHMNPSRRAQYLLSSAADVLVNEAQGEKTLLELARNAPNQLDRVPNLLWRTPTGEVVENPRQEESNDINWTPIEPDRIPEGSIVHLRTARSCTFKCAFCSYPTIAGKPALMDLERVMSTLRRCRERGVRAIFFVDDTFNVPRDRFEALVETMIREGLDIPWYSFLRCQFVDARLVARMRESGCRGVFLGIESGSDRILRNMQKGAVSAAYRDGIRWLANEGIIAVGSFVVGFPGETRDTVEETRGFIESSQVPYYYAQPFYYLHHTPVHHRAERFGLTGTGLFWRHDTMDSAEAIEHVNRLFLTVNGSVWVNPDYTLWEIAYLLSKGMTLAEVDDYRRRINAMTADQMERFAL